MIQHSVKNAARSALYYTGALGLFHRLRNKRTLTTFMFHRVLPAGSKEFELAEREFTFSVDGFGRCLDFIQKHYQVVKLVDLQRSLQPGGPSLPNNAALITFDDGWRDTLVHAQPELKRRDMSAVLFLATEVLSLTHDRWWQDVLVQVLHDPHARSLFVQELQQLADTPEIGRNPTNRQLTAALASMPESNRIGILARVHALATLPRQMVTSVDLQHFEKAVLELGAHGHTHAPLTDVKDGVCELAQSYEEIKMLGATPITMSFPHGAYNGTLVDKAKTVGYRFIFTSEPTLTSTANNGFTRLATVGRIHVPENQWTCTNQEVSAPMLATFLFFRTVVKPI